MVDKSIEAVEREKKQQEVEKAMGEPFAIDFSESVRTMRTHLLIGSTIGLAAFFMGLKIKPDSTVFGLQFEGLTDAKITWLLLLVNVYLFIHFLWSSIDALQEWRLRVSGSKVAFVTGMTWGHESVDYPADPRQSTLYNWWVESAKGMTPIKQTLDQVDEKLGWVMKKMEDNLSLGQDPSLIAIQTANQEMTKSIRDLRSSMDKASELLTDARIPVSLKRFDRAFEVFLRSQNMRWLLLEWLFPIAVGMSAIGLLVKRVL